MCVDADTCGLADSGGTALPTVPEMVITLLTSTPFRCRPTIQSPHPQPPPLLGSHTLGHSSPFLLTPGPGTRPLETDPVAQSLLELFKLANSKPTLTLPLHIPIPSQRNYMKAVAHIFPPTPPRLPPDWPCCLPISLHPCGTACPFRIGTVYNKVFFSFKKHLFIFRERKGGRKKERFIDVREIHQ